MSSSQVLQNQLSPEEEQELVSKILKRAELAQMTRELKFYLIHE